MGADADPHAMGVVTQRQVPEGVTVQTPPELHAPPQAGAVEPLHVMAGGALHRHPFEPFMQV
jgi:hypothetical protein